ncbi:TPA: hypothetical protein IB053_002404 [Escherichia coli]|nr:hypothetical protein [Escherichia coli]
MTNITDLTAKLKAECKASRLWERLDDAARDNAQQMRNIALESLVALDKAEILNADLREALEAAEQRIAELEARTLTVKLPNSCEHDVMAPVAAFMYEDGYEFDQEDYTAVAGRVRSELETVLRRALRAAGIKLQIEGE